MSEISDASYEYMELMEILDDIEDGNPVMSLDEFEGRAKEFYDEGVLWKSEYEEIIARVEALR